METDQRMAKPEEVRQFASQINRGFYLLSNVSLTLEEKQARLDDALRIIAETRHLRNALLSKVADALAKERKTNTTVDDECRSVVKDERIEAVLNRIAEAIGIRCDNCQHFRREFLGAICGQSGLLGCEYWTHNRSEVPKEVRYTAKEMREASDTFWVGGVICEVKNNEGRVVRQIKDDVIIAMLRQAAASEEYRQYLDIEVTRLEDELRKRDLELFEAKRKLTSGDTFKEVLDQVRFELNSAKKMREFEKDDKTCELLDLRIEAFQRVLRKAGE